MKKPEARLCIAPLSLAGPEGAGRRLPGRLLPFFLRLGFADAHGIGQSTFSWRRKIKHGIMEPAGCAIHVAEENSPSPPLIMERMDPAYLDASRRMGPFFRESCLHSLKMKRQREMTDMADTAEGIFWLSDFCVPTDVGVAGRFKAYMEEKGLCTQADYCCARTVTTANTAIAYEAFRRTVERGGRFFLGVWENGAGTKDGTWTVYQLSKETLEKKFRDLAARKGLQEPEAADRVGISGQGEGQEVNL